MGYIIGGQGFMAAVNKPRPPVMPSDSVCLLINPWHCAMTTAKIAQERAT